MKSKCRRWTAESTKEIEVMKDFSNTERGYKKITFQYKIVTIVIIVGIVLMVIGSEYEYPILWILGILSCILMGVMGLVFRYDLRDNAILHR